MDASDSSCRTPRRRWMVWMPFVAMGFLFAAVLVYPGILKSPWGVLLVGITAAGCPVMCLGAMALQALAMKSGSEPREPKGSTPTAPDPRR